ncbi:MAG: hypothetical protein JSS02_23530 [Planctomycetes bacterium]|nr:hypothetical protein [Planctomycetota bacterium]
MKRVLLPLLAMVALGAQVASATTLQDIIDDGNSVVFGDKTFSNFVYSRSTIENGLAGTASAPTASEITVTFSNTGPDYYVTFSGFSLTADAFLPGDSAEANMAISFNVTAGPGFKIASVDQSVTGSWTANRGHAYSEETVTGVGTMTTNAGTSSTMNVTPPLKTLHISKDVNVLAEYNGGDSTAHISVVQQSFHQVVDNAPEINANLLVSAVSLLLGSVAVLFGRKKFAVNAA